VDSDCNLAAVNSS